MGKSVYQQLSERITPKEWVMISPLLEKDDRTYARIGELEDGREIYKRITFDDAGQGKMKEETLLIETVDSIE